MPNDFGLKPAAEPTKPALPPEGDRNWPAWYYSADGDSRIFNGPEEVPEGWATSEYNARQLKREKDKAERDAKRDEPKELMPRKAIIAELKDRGIEFDWKKPTGELWQLLRDLREHEGSKDEAKIAAANGVVEDVKAKGGAEQPAK